MLRIRYRRELQTGEAPNTGGRRLSFRSLVLCSLVLVLGLGGVVPSLLAKDWREFANAVSRYVAMRRELDSSVHPQKTTPESEQIADRRQQLTGLLAGARRKSQRGEIFTEKVSGDFREIIRKAFREPGGKAMRKTIEELDPIKPVSPRVNEVYPEDQPRTTMPPTLLNRLPVLPKKLTYRIIHHALALQDTGTGHIVDFIPNAIP